MSKAAARRAFYAMLMGVPVGPVIPPVEPSVFDIRDYWLGVEMFDINDDADPRDIWLME